MGKTKLTLAAMAAAFVGTGAMAASVSIDSITASFGAPDPSGFTDFTYDINDPAFNNGTHDLLGTPGLNTDGDTASIFWGNPAGADDHVSGYQFVPTATPFPAPAMPGDILSLGTFTHFNFPIFDPPGAITGVPLTFSFSGTPAGGSQETFPATFNFVHDETLNEAPCAAPSPTPCSDFVSFTAEGGADEVVTVDDVIYTFTVLGFGEVVAGEFVPLNPAEPFLFITTEGAANSTDLFFTYSTQVVPLPAAGWLMLAGLGALGAVGRRRKKAA